MWILRKYTFKFKNRNFYRREQTIFNPLRFKLETQLMQSRDEQPIYIWVCVYGETWILWRSVHAPLTIMCTGDVAQYP